MGAYMSDKRKQHYVPQFYMKEYVDFYKSVIDQDRSAVVMCNLNHEIIYMNPAAITYYAKGGGEQLIGKSVIRFSDFKGQVNCFFTNYLFMIY
jgi:PAS domain-containing protein